MGLSIAQSSVGLDSVRRKDFIRFVHLKGDFELTAVIEIRHVLIKVKIKCINKKCVYLLKGLKSLLLIQSEYLFSDQC